MRLLWPDATHVRPADGDGGRFWVSCSQEPNANISIGTGGDRRRLLPLRRRLGARSGPRHIPGVKAVAEVTGASVENVRLAHRGETEIGEIMGGRGASGLLRRGSVCGGAHRISWRWAVMYPNVFQVVTLSGSGIDALSQLKGRTVSIGAPGSGTAFMSDLVLEALEITHGQLPCSPGCRLWKVPTPSKGPHNRRRHLVRCPAHEFDHGSGHDARREAGSVPTARTNRSGSSARHSFYSAYDPAGGRVPWHRRASAFAQRVERDHLPRRSARGSRLSACAFAVREQRVLAEDPPVRPATRRLRTPCSMRPSPLHAGAIRFLREQGLEIPDRLVREE